MNQQPEALYNFGNVDWDKALNATPETLNQQSVERDLRQDLFELTDGVNRGLNPEDLFANTRLARATGMPLSAVMNDKESALMVQVRNALEGKVDATLPYIRGEQKIATDMFHILPAGESAAIVTDKHLWRMGEVQRGIIGETKHSLDVGNQGQLLQDLYFKEFGGLSTDEDKKRISLLEASLAVDAERREGESTLQAIHRGSVGLLPQFRDLGINVVRRGTQGAIALGTATAITGTGIGALTGSVVPVAGTGVGATVGGGVGAIGGGITGFATAGPAGAFEHIYKQSIGEIWGSIRQYKDEHGNSIDPTTARTIAALGALPMAGLDMLSMGKAVKLVPGLDKILNKTSVETAVKFLQKNPGIAGATKDALQKASIAYGTEVITEVAQEHVVMAAEELAKNTGKLDMSAITYDEYKSRTLETFKETATSVLPYSLLGGGARAYANSKIQQSQASADAIQQIHTLATESETLKNAPELAQEFQKRLGENGGASEVYVRPDALQRVFFQSEAGIAAAADMGITPEMLAESIALDTDIAIPMDKALTHILNNDQAYNELRQDMRTSPDIMTPREAGMYASPSSHGYSLDSELDRLREEFHESTKNTFLSSERTELDWALDVATATSLADVETFKSHLAVALSHGRHDIVRAILERVKRHAKNFQTTPGVGENNPKYQTIKSDLASRKAEAQRDAEQLESFARDNGYEGAPSQMDREVSDFLDSIFSGLEEEIATNKRRDDLAAPYVEQLKEAGYTERQAQHMATLPVAHAEVMSPLFNQTAEEYLSQRLGGFEQTTPAMLGKTEADYIEQSRRQFNRSSLGERDPLLALVHGRMDGVDIKNYDPHAPKELRSKYGVGLFKKKGQGGLPLDWLADEAVRSGLLPEGSGANELLAALQDRKRFYQPLNPDVNLDKHIPVVAAEKETAPVWKSMKGADKKAIVDSIVGELVNEATGETIELSRTNASHLIGSTTGRGIGGQAHIAAVRNIKELMRVGEKIESYPDRKEQKNVRTMHRFFAPLHYDNDIYAVNMAVREYDGTRLVELEGVHKLYDVKLENKKPTGIADKLTPETSNPVVRPEGLSEITIRQMLEGVKDSEGNSFFQNKNNARGVIDFSNPQAVIYLFKGKSNLSTVIHETGHFFLENLSEAAQLENAPAWVKKSWEAIQKEYNFEGHAIPEEAHERFAREFEAYAREGKAPSSYLENAFRQFSNWLVRLYKSVRSILGGDEISPEVREVFDRLLATEQEIEAARVQGKNNASLGQMVEAGLEVSPELKDRYARAVTEAHNKAEAIIQARRLVEQRKVEKEFRKEAEQDVLRDVFYIGEASVREQGGIQWQSVLDYIDEDLAQELRRKWTTPLSKSFFKDSGSLDFMDAASQFNEDSPHNFAGLLLAMPTRKEAVDARVQSALAEWNKTFEGSIEYSNAMDEVIALELEALTGKKQLSGALFRGELDRRMGVKKTSAVDAEYKALKASLRKQNAVLKDVMREVRQEQKELKKDAQQAFKDGVVAGEMHEGAKRAKEKSHWQKRLAELKLSERAKRTALASAYKARVERTKLVRQIRKSALSKSIHDGHKQQILALVGHWRKLGTPTMLARDIENLMPLRDFIGQNESLFGETESLFPDWILNESSVPGEKGLGDLSLEEFRELHRAIQILAHQGRTYNKLLSFEKEVQLTEAAGEMIDSMDKAKGKRYLSEQDRAKFQGKIVGMFRGTTSELTAMRYVFDALDGYVNKGGKDSATGPGHKYVVSRFQKALDKERKVLREFDGKLSAALQKLIRPDMRKAFVMEGIPLAEDVAREWGGMFTHEKVIAVALNMGNEGNIKALKRGFGWSDADLQTIISRLSKEELATVQEIWNILDEIYPLLNETHQTMNGVPLSRVEAQAASLQGKDGTIDMEGGYYPLIFDHALSRKAEEQQNTDVFQNRCEAILRSPNPKSGMTKERKGGTLPPKLSLSVIHQHLVDSIHYATHAPVLHDVYRMVKMPEYRNAFIRAAGLEAYNELIPWLRYIARPEGEQITRIDRYVEWAAKRGTLYVLAFNMKSAFLQLSSLGNSIVEVGGAQFMKGSYQLLKHPVKTFRAVKEKSAYMESRSRLLDASLREWLDEFNPDGARGISFLGKRFTLEQFRNAQFAFIQGLDAVVAYPTWVAAYDAAIAAGVKETDAIQRGNEAVIRAQGSGGVMDVSKVLRRRGFIKLFTPFMTFALNDFNRKKYYTAGFVEYARGGHSNIDFKTYAQHLALEWIAPVVFSSMMLSLGRDGELPDAEDYFWEAMGFYLMGVPVVRDVVRSAEVQFTGKGYGRGIGGSVAFAGLESGIKAAQAGSKALLEDDERAAKRFQREMINTMGFMIGVGTPQLWRTMDGVEAFFVDDEGGVLAPFLGKPQKKKD